MGLSQPISRKSASRTRPRLARPRRAPNSWFPRSSAASLASAALRPLPAGAATRTRNLALLRMFRARPEEAKWRPTHAQPNPAFTLAHQASRGMASRGMASESRWVTRAHGSAVRARRPRSSCRAARRRAPQARSRAAWSVLARWRTSAWRPRPEAAETSTAVISMEPSVLPPPHSSSFQTAKTHCSSHTSQAKAAMQRWWLVLARSSSQATAGVISTSKVALAMSSARLTRARVSGSQAAASPAPRRSPPQGRSKPWRS
mmetsp:Transcript_157904/g.483912  ORF Transcript_157904/g.483912 Transcript_157904/m.483912 type:complete len:260 (+) Transcript_157904:200-979(+)